MNKYYTLFFSLFFLSNSSQNDLEKIKDKYQSINSYNLNYNLVISTLKENNTVNLIEESGIMYGNNSSFMIKHKNMDIISDGKKIYNVIHNIREIPKSLTIVGAGVIGLELGQVYNRLGSEVNVIEYSEKITPFMDDDVSKELLKIFKKEKINFYLSSKVFDVKSNDCNVIVKAENKSGEILQFISDYCLVSVGRKPYTENLGLDSVGVDTDKFGRIIIDRQFKTSNKDIFAIGDVVSGPMLAHKAEEEGIAVAEILKNQKPHIDYNLIPNVIYTWPEVSSVGKTEQQLVEEKINYKKGSFPMRALGRSRASNDLSGFVKILADKKTDEILGVHIIGARAADLITEAVTAMEFKASCEDIAMMSHPHPTYSEALKEAALAALENRPLHI